MSEQHTCVERVSNNPNWTTFRECGNKAKVEREGKWYCGRHDPVKRKEKAYAKYAKFLEEADARSKQRMIERAAPEMFELLIEARDKGVSKSWFERRDAVIKKVRGGE